METTVLYYSSSHESPEFEARIVADLKEKAAGLPIVSVTQKPLDLGTNICVGDVGLSYPNEYRQILIGARAVETDWIITAESDFLYPFEYLTWQPPGRAHSLYWYDPIWIVWSDPTRRAYRKGNSEGAMYVRRDFLIEQVEKYLEDYPTWTTEYHGGLVWKHVAHPRTVHGETPAVSFKTGRGVNWHCGVLGGIENHSGVAVPGWGKLADIRREWLGDQAE